jgi:hypothetical protein
VLPPEPVRYRWILLQQQRLYRHALRRYPREECAQHQAVVISTSLCEVVGEETLEEGGLLTGVLQVDDIELGLDYLAKGAIECDGLEGEACVFVAGSGLVLLLED